MYVTTNVGGSPVVAALPVSVATAITRATMLPVESQIVFPSKSETTIAEPWKNVFNLIYSQFKLVVILPPEIGVFCE